MKTLLGRLFLLALVGLLLFVGVAFFRLQLAVQEIKVETQSVGAGASIELGETQKLEILPLYEKGAAPDGLQSGHGVSYLIRTDSTTILFDVGNNLKAAPVSPLEHNMAALGISLDEIDMVVVSHRHPDHTGGNQWGSKMTFSPAGLSQPPLGDRPIYVPEPMTYPGSQPVFSEAPIRLSDDTATTGVMTFSQPFPIWLALPKGDEQALAIHVAGQGIVLVTGCGHMGLSALLERADALFQAPVAGVIGGLHYGNASAQELQPQIDLLHALDPGVVALSPHDSGPQALEAFAQGFPTAYQPIQVGQAIQFP